MIIVAWFNRSSFESRKILAPSLLMSGKSIGAIPLAIPIFFFPSGQMKTYFNISGRNQQVLLLSLLENNKEKAGKIVHGPLKCHQCCLIINLQKLLFSENVKYSKGLFFLI